MRLWECRIAVTRRAAATATDAFGARGERRWVLFEDRPAGRLALTGYFAARPAALAAGRRLLAALAPAGRCGPLRVRRLADADWRESYRAHFHHWRLGRLHWVPAWERPTTTLPAGHRAVWLDPGMAFGTGNHETTRLCCRRLVAYAHEAGSGASGGKWSRSVIDAGCGSGILAISAARLGLGPVFGFDLDGNAVRISRANAALNGVRDRVTFQVRNLAAGLASRRAGLVLANIQADVLQRHARALVRAVAPGGWLVLSGLLAGERRTTRAAVARYTAGWGVSSRVLGEWADLVFRRPG